MAGAAMEVAAVAERVGLALASQEVDTTGAEAAAPEAPVWTLDGLRGQPLPEPEAIVYLLAYARARPYYINVASRGELSSLVNAYTIRNAIYRVQKRRYGLEQETPLYLVYFESYASGDAAVARCAHRWSMPHFWQRKLIERFNSWWLNVIDELIAFPCSTHVVGEHGLVPLEQATSPELKREGHP